MTWLLTTLYAVHLLFAGLWAGSVLFMAYAVLPTAQAGDIRAKPLAAITSKLTMLSRASVIVMLISGGYIAGQVYGGGMMQTTNGTLVISMVILWLVLSALVEVGASRLRDGLEEQRVRAPASNSAVFYQVAAVVGVVLLLIGGVLSVS